MRNMPGIREETEFGDKTEFREEMEIKRVM
jgi:hypothetical protein